MHATLSLLQQTDFPSIRRRRLNTLQVNLGYRCNQQCLHCHVDAGPRRSEMMSRDTVNDIIRLLSSGQIETIDITGGAPELHPEFRRLVERACALGIHVIDRCNLTVLNEAGQENTAEFLAAHQVEIIASLPCYSEENVDAQRGKGVFQSSIEAMRKLNELGYAQPFSDHVLNLVYNPTGPFLPPSQSELEKDYKEKLDSQFAVQFNSLFTLTNMPIKRFGSTLISRGEFDDYMQLLKASYNPDTLETVMCRELISVDWKGFVYDCDFNQMLALPLSIKGKQPVHISKLNLEELENNPIIVADHCYGCTAGQGSSCGGALNE